MTEQMVIQVVSDAFYHALLIVGPLLLVSLVVGLFIAILQAATTVSEQTLTFVPKLLAVFLVIVLLLPYMIKTLKSFFFEIMKLISGL